MTPILQQCLSLLQIELIEAFGKPAVERSDKLAKLNLLALIAPEAAQIHQRSKQENKKKTRHDKVELLKDAGVLVIEPQSALSGEDFREISRAIDPYTRDQASQPDC